MNNDPIYRALQESFEDHRLSRKERKSLQKLVEELPVDQHKQSLVRSWIFEIAQQSIKSDETKSVLTWVADAIKATDPKKEPEKVVSEAFFSTEDACAMKIVNMIQKAQKSIDICVFTITDDRISDALAGAYRRVSQLRIITDDEKSRDLGSDIQDLRKLGVEIVTDRDPAHMHHKYAIFDRRWLLTGSYNWTRSAANYNEENFVVTNEPDLTRQFQSHFEELWRKLQADS